MKRTLAGVLVAASLCAAVQADLKKGVFAPDIEAKQWINADQSLSLKDLRGLVVVLYFWQTTTRAGEFFMEDINILHNHRALGRARGVIVIGVTDADFTRVNPAIEREKASFPVALESQSYKDYELERMPAVVIVDPVGRIAWSGAASEGDTIVREVFSVLDENPPTRTRPTELEIVNRRMDEARNALRDRAYVRAFRAARDAFEHTVTGDPAKTMSQDLIDLIDLLARDRMATVDELLEEKKFTEAVALLRTVIREFSGVAAARDARRRLVTLRRQYDEIKDVLKGEQTTVEAVRLLARVRERVTAQRFGEAYATIQQILDNYGQTDVAPIARGILDRMKENPQIAMALRDHDARRDCEMWIGQAKNFISQGRRREASDLLRKVISSYPDTTYEREAVEMLKRLP
jgi:peroxiredoxin